MSLNDCTVSFCVMKLSTPHTADHDFCIQDTRIDEYAHIYTHKKQTHKYMHMHTYT